MIPPNIDGLNDERASWASSALRQFQHVTGTDDEDALADLLGDLMHWADRHEVSFTTELERAQRYYQEETTVPQR